MISLEKVIPPLLLLCWFLQPSPAFSSTSGPLLNISCSASAPCPEGAVCLDGECSCPFPDHQTVIGDAPENWSCMSWISGPCQEELDGTTHTFPCVANSACSNPSGVMECTCLPGFQAAGRACVGDYGQSCTTKEDCLIGFGCWNGKCACGGLEEYDQGLNKCLGMVGARCQTELDCIANTRCTLHPENSFNVQYSCRCEPSFETTPDRHCVQKK